MIPRSAMLFVTLYPWAGRERSALVLPREREACAAFWHSSLQKQANSLL
jgi:hypothetical protein